MEQIKLGDNQYQEITEILKREEINRIPAYSGYGLEVYQNNDKQVQIIVNLRDDNKTLTINRGY